MTTSPPPDAFFDGLHMPEAEVAIDEALVRALIVEQAPQYASLSVTIVDSGWDNVMVRLGDHLAVRLPRRELAVPLLQNEQRWLPLLAPLLPLPIPSPIFCGVESARFRWPWSIVPWLDGDTADTCPLRADQVDVFVSFFDALHRPAPQDAPHNPFRACSLGDKGPGVEQRFAALTTAANTQPDLFAALGIDHPLAALAQWRGIWDRSVERLPSDDRVWIAGDVHARNVIARDGVLAGFIDFGDLTVGDRSTDLSSIWALFDDATSRERAVKACRLEGDALARAHGWAIFSGVTLLQTGLAPPRGRRKRVDHLAHARMGADVLRRLTEDSQPQ